MDIIIREDIGQYMKDLKQWLSETRDCSLEEMADFFSARIDGYEDHMSLWKRAYRRFAGLIPENCTDILDLGCGTGLELDEIFKRFPDVSVTGIDLCRDMLNRLKEKHQDKNLELICADYFQYELRESCRDVILSFESLHHFRLEEKKRLYRKLNSALKDGGTFLLCDYIACCEEEEELLFAVCREKREKFNIPQERFVHFDTPLTLDHEIRLLEAAGFSMVSAVDCIDGATIIRAEK